ncbi:MAG: terminase small subunit [Planctomycetota bacterium]|jgi:phage terminase small subunit
MEDLYPSDRKLTDKQKRFCQEYLVDLNATQAAKRAGYSEASASSIGEENLRKRAVWNHIRLLLAQRALRTRVTADQVVERLKKIAFADEGVKTGDQLKALQMLAKHIGLFDKPDERLTRLIEGLRPDRAASDPLAALSERESQAVAVMTLLDPMPRQAVSQQLRKNLEAIESGNGEDKPIETDRIKIMLDRYGAERIRQSVLSNLNALLSAD